MSVLAVGLWCSILAGPGLAADNANVDEVRYPRAQFVPPVRARELDERLAAAVRDHEHAAALASMERDHPFLGQQFGRGKGCDVDILVGQIAFMVALIDDADPDDPELPDYLFRLADLYLTQADCDEHQALWAGYRLLESQDDRD